MRRKLIDFLGKSLNEEDQLKVRSHLDSCLACRKRIADFSALLRTTAKLQSPDPSQEFWHDFKVDLDKRLNEELLSSASPSVHPLPGTRFIPRPALAYLAVLIFFLVIGASFYRNLISQDNHLIEEAVTLDEINNSNDSNQSKDAFLEELNLLYQFGQFSKPGSGI